MDLAHELEEAVSTQPYADRPAEHYLAAGRRARSRRRLSVLGVGAATVVIAGVGGIALHPSPVPAGLPATGSPSVASQGRSPSAGPSAEVSTGTVVGDWDQRNMARSGAGATYTLDGQVKLATGWHVTQRIASPWGHTSAFGDGNPVDKSVALEVAKGSRVQWLLMDYESGNGGGSGAIYDDDPAARGFASLQAYADVQMALRLTRSTDELVAFGADGTLEPRNGITVLEQAPVELADGTRATAARLQVLGNEWWVYAAVTASGPVYIPVSFPFVGDEDSVAGFRDHVSDLVAQGELG